ncbi:CO or xanthine dehydrogenase, Mo-binding subunit [Mesorhizobium albiziae]|uniref:CO or xanthine dehydrogenase, Mo-binding subunit n=2 Tax=Neomesorhizobium albiziae TaxID=335020 RepID=A0A1I4BYK6_9HYPH|nr:CO or xanthine dehydrogenase, Mo-binding subunit [Mesorhizobium albiziae]
MRKTGISRREFGIGFGTLVAAFSLEPVASLAQVVEGAAPVSFAKNGRLDAWIRVGADGAVTIFTGKAELGQGILTALSQIAAEELDLAIEQINIISADTTRGPDEGYTYGSQSIEQSGMALRVAGAQARAVLMAAAATRLNVAVETLSVERGSVRSQDGRQVSYAEIATGDPELLRRDVSSAVRVKKAADYKIVGKSVPRIDFPQKVTGEAAFLQDMRLPGMLFGRVVRPPRAGAQLLSFEEAAVRALPGVSTVVRKGSFLGVVAAREEQAIAAMQLLREISRWTEDGPRLPRSSNLPDELRKFAKEDVVVSDTGQGDAAGIVHQWVEASYSRPYLSQAAIGPSCAVAHFADGRMTVWSHTQGAFPLRGDLAKALQLPAERVDVIHMQGSGCYGHNGADDVALDAALLAIAVEGQPVKLQWMRDDEFIWSPSSPAMAMKARAGLSADGKIVDWQYELWSNTHATRPGQPGGLNLLASWYFDEPFHVSPPLKIPQPYGNGDRNAVPLYDLPRQRIVNHLLTDMPIRTGSLRTLGGHGNIYAIECFMDELAMAAGRDPVEFRLAHLSDPRGRAVIEAAATKAGWAPNSRSDGRHGRGFAYARYKNISTFAAVVVDVDVDPSSGAVRVLKAVAAIDVGQIINPDGVISQTEGGLIQGISWALKEQIMFDERAVTSRDWADYPILTFDEAPEIEVVLIDRPNEPSIGAGEGSVGPASAALANALAHATGRRVRDLPLTSNRIYKGRIG